MARRKESTRQAKRQRVSGPEDTHDTTEHADANMGMAQSLAPAVDMNAY
jgi:hypothetical protein